MRGAPLKSRENPISVARGLARSDTALFMAITSSTFAHTAPQRFVRRCFRPRRRACPGGSVSGTRLCNASSSRRGGVRTSPESILAPSTRGTSKTERNSFLRPKRDRATSSPRGRTRAGVNGSEGSGAESNGSRGRGALGDDLVPVTVQHLKHLRTESRYRWGPAGARAARAARAEPRRAMSGE